MRRTTICMLLVQTLWPAPGRGDDRVDFAHDVLPLIRDRCANCHTNGKSKGDVSMDTRESLLKSEAIVPGKSGQSVLIERVTNPDPEERMPKKGPPLTEKQIALLRKWIDEGAAWQEGFSFAKSGAGLPVAPHKPELPPAQEGRTNPVDRLVDAYFASHHLTPPPALSDAAFFRRVSLDLVGLLPTPEQLVAFEEASASDKRERLVERLLDDNQAYAEHWLTFWNDLLRNDYVGTGYVDGGRKAITDWLYRSLRENKPYDQFVRELINPASESEGFIKGIIWRGVVNASQVREIQFAQNTGQVFLGVNLKCASCHDSFIDSWKLADSYGLAAVVADKPLEMFRCDKPTGARAQARFLFPELGEIDASKPKPERLKELSELLTSPKNGLLTRTIVNRIWQRLLGRGIVHPVDVMSNTPWSYELIDYLSSNLVDQNYDLKRTIAQIVNSRAYQSRSIHLEGNDLSDSEFVFRGPISKRMTAEEFVDAIWQITGTAPEKPAVPFKRDSAPVRAALVEADPLMRSLGRPNREQVVTTRPDDLSTLQALDLTNGPELSALLDRGVKKLCAKHPTWGPGQFINWVFQSALSRKPTAAELETAADLLTPSVTDEGLSDLLWAVFMLPEFQLIQ